MANVSAVRAPLVVQFIANDGGGGQNLVTSPCTIVSNRQYTLVDYAIVVTTGSGDGADAGAGVFNQARLRIRTVTSLGTTELGTVNAVAASTNTWHRPTTVTLPGATAVATDCLVTTASAVIARGNTLRVDADSSGAGVAADVRALGTIRILPGNRYSTTTSTTNYYANNAATGAQGSAATQNI